MLALESIQKSFNELQNITPLHQISGQKDIFLAQHEDKPAVLKIVKPSDFNIGRCERECEAVDRLKLSCVPKIFAWGKKTIGTEERFFIIEQCIQGQTYRQYMNPPNRPLKEVLKLGKLLLEACVAFEKEKIVHRDIKPENIMIDKGGNFWIIDFGLARHLDKISLTPSGPGGVGTIGYGPPEQLRNIKPNIDSRADLFSIGVVMYEALVGFNPYLKGVENQVEAFRRMDSQDLPRLNLAEDENGELSLLISSLTARFLSRRPSTAQEALDLFIPIRAKFTAEKE